jgi:hypothetical protein
MYDLITLIPAKFSRIFSVRSEKVSELSKTVMDTFTDEVGEKDQKGRGAMHTG